jgi:uncharacterized SAM-binding protein YcdF (DUF218 family)
MIGKILGLLLAPIILFVGLVLTVNYILSVDDLAVCGSQPSVIDQRCQKVDAIVAISGGDTNARTREAIQLYKNNWAPYIVLSGAAIDRNGPSNAAAMRNQALNAGISSSAIVLDEFAKDTAANAIGLRAIATEYDLKRIIVVTSPYHQRRASMEFSRSLGPGVTVLNHPTAEDRYWQPFYWWLNPYSWYLAISELTKLTYIGLSGT